MKYEKKKNTFETWIFNTEFYGFAGLKLVFPTAKIRFPKLDANQL